MTAIPEATYRTLPAVPLRRSTKSLYSPGHKPLEMVGELSYEMICKDKSTVQQIFVVKGLASNLLGLPAIIALDLVARVEAVTDYGTTVQRAFPKVFEGLGKFGEPYHIQLQSTKHWVS